MKKQCFLKKIFWLAIICLPLLILVSCGTPPKTDNRDIPKVPEDIASSSDITTEHTESSETVDNSHLAELPERVEDVYEQGNLSLVLAAQVLPVMQEKIYQWDSTVYNISDESFQKKMADNLLKENYSKEENANGGSNYVNDEGALSFNPDINHTSYRAAITGEIDTTMGNFVSDEALDNKYVEQLNFIIADLGISHFLPAFCAKYGNQENGFFYEIVWQPIIEGLPIINSGVQPSSFEEIPPYEEIRACIGEDEELLLLNFRASQIDEKSKKEVEVIKLDEALNILKKEGLAVLSKAMVDSKSLTVQTINLAYAHSPNNGTFQLVPIWMFTLDRVDNDGNKSNVTFAVDAVTGKMV